MKPSNDAQHGEDLAAALGERVKELACIYAVSEILSRAEASLADRLGAVVERLPAGWQFPQRAEARITVDGKSFSSPGWSDSSQSMQATIVVDGDAVGSVEVVYLGPVRGGDEDVFLREEELLIGEIARRVGHALALERGRRQTSTSTAAPKKSARSGADGPQGLIGQSPAMKQVYRSIEKVAASDATVLIVGESGTGKELVARAIHYGSARATGPFVAVNCAAIPEALFESELFGYVKGAFTGAQTSRAGFFQTAEGGTVFLDEVSEMNLNMQAKLLRVVQDHEVRMVGSDKSRRTDVRIIAATNKNLGDLVEKERFRADLYFRLNVVSIELPRLRDRGDDVRLLVDYFSNRWSAETGGERLVFSDEALDALGNYDWPGNVRELDNLVARLSVMSDARSIEVDMLPMPMRSGATAATDERGTLAEVERAYIRRVLAEVDGNRTQAAARLGIDRKTLRKKLDGP